MERLRKLLASEPSEAEVRQFVAELEKGTTPCSAFVDEASTANVYKVCPKKLSGECEVKKDCLAIKVAKKGSELSDIESDVQKEITRIVKGSAAEAHFNKILDVLPTPNGPVIVTEFEQPRAQPFKKVSHLLQKADIAESLWKSINFQLLKTLYTAQQLIPGFTHNDTHTDNLLVVPNDTSHACVVTTPKGKRLAHFSTVLIRVIDFGQVLAKDESLQTPDGIAIWKETLFQNKMIDFLRFACWAVIDIGFSEERELKYPPWYQSWLDFILRYLDPRFFNVTPGKEAAWADRSMGMAPTKEGAAWLQEWYGPDSENGLGNMLDDPYFNDLVLPELTFSAQIKPKKLEFRS